MKTYSSLLFELKIFHMGAKPGIVTTTKPIKNPEEMHKQDTGGRGGVWRKSEAKGKSVHISTMASGHHIYKSEDKKKHETTFYAYHPERKQVDAVMVGQKVKHHENGTTTMEPHTAGREGGTVKPHELYHHLITKHNIILHTGDHQTEGGKSVWQKLAKKKGISVHTVDAHGKPENLHPNKDEGDIWTTHPKEHEVGKRTLVASKKA